MVTRLNLLHAIHGEFNFRLRAEALPGDLRPEWRIAVILVMVLRCGRAGKMSLKKAHLLDWAVRTATARGTLSRMVQGQRELSDVPVRFDPALNRALDFARGEKLVHIDKKTTGSLIRLLPAGELMAENIYKEPDCLEVEKAFFNSLRGKLPEDKVTELLDWETKL